MLVRSTARGLLVASAMTSRAPGRQPYVLIADTHAKFANDLGKALAVQGLHAQVVYDGATVIEHIEQAAREPATTPTPDLVVCDSSTPKCDGFAVIDALRRSAVRPAVAPSFLLMTDARDPSVLQRALLLGAAGVLRKPFQLEDFVDEVLAVLGRPSSARA